MIGTSAEVGRQRAGGGGGGGAGSRWVPVLLVVLTLVAMGRLCAMDFSQWDDDKTVWQNPRLNPPTAEGVGYYWTHEYMGLYVPVTYTVWAGLAEVARVEPDARGIELNPWVFHSFNVLVHVCNVLVVYAILRRLGGRPWAAGVGAAVFGVHPVQVEAVAWVAGLKDLLCGTFVLLAVWQYLVFAEGRRDGEAGRKVWAHYWVGLGCVVVGTLCKPTAVVAPVLVAALDVWVVGRGWKKVAKDVWPWALAVVPCVVWAKLVQTVVPRGPLWSRPLVALDAVAFYLGKLVWPGQTAIDYGRNPAYVIATGQVWWTWVVPAAVAAGLWVGRRRVPVLVGAGLAFAGGLGPVLGLTPFMFQGYSTVADHYLYLPMLGAAVTAAWAVGRWPGKGTAVAAGVVVVLLGVRSMVEEGAWADDETLNRHTLAVNPRSSVAHLNLGVELWTRGNETGSAELRRQAEAHLREAIRLKPDAIAARENLAQVMIAEGKVDEAVRLMEETLRVADTLPPNERAGVEHSHYALGLVLAKRGRYAEAAGHFEKALAYDPGDRASAAALAAVREKMREEKDEGRRMKDERGGNAERPTSNAERPKGEGLGR